MKVGGQGAFFNLSDLGMTERRLACTSYICPEGKLGSFRQ